MGFLCDCLFTTSFQTPLQIGQENIEDSKYLAVQVYLEINKTVILTQRAFWRKFAVSDANTIQMWIKQLEETGNTLKKGKL